MANTFKGASLLWGTGSTTGTIGPLGSITLLQSKSVDLDAQMEEIADSDGNAKTLVFYNQKLKESLEFVLTSTATDAGAITVASMLSAGVTVAIADAQMVPAAGTWIVTGVSLTGSNTKAALAKVDLLKCINNTIPA